MPYDASDRKSIRKAEKAVRLASRSRQEVLANLMSTTQGREWIWNKLEDAHIFTQTYVSDPLATAFAEGQRSVGLALLADIMAIAPDQFIQAMRESHVRHLADNRDAAPEQPGGQDSERGVEGRTVDADFDPYREAIDRVNNSTDRDWGDQDNIYRNEGTR